LSAVHIVDQHNAPAPAMPASAPPALRIEQKCSMMEM
jgi:hypothetical protein